MEGLPVGTGRLAAMVWGGMKHERLTLNHEWLWRGQYRDRDNRRVADGLDEVRRLLLDGCYAEGTAAGNDLLASYTGRRGEARIDSYQPGGELWIETDLDQVYDYRRELDIAAGVVRVACSSRADGRPTRRMERHIIAPLEEDLIFVRIAAFADRSDEPAEFSARLRFDRAIDPGCEVTARADGDLLRMVGRFETGMRFECQARIWLAGSRARLEPRDGAMHVHDARELIVAIDIGTSAKGGEPREECRLPQLTQPDWADLLARHERRFARELGDFSLELPVAEPALPTDERVARLRAGQDDPALMLLYFNFGRYLLACSSANGELPAHLQGKWNEDVHPAWFCDYHLNINVQMNYWPAEVTGMGGCTGALLRYIERMVPHARQAAADLYGCGGVYFPQTSDAWARATPEHHGWGTWTGAAAWLAQHVWWRYEFTRDAEYLAARSYPFLKLVGEFYEDYLVPGPDGRLAIVPSQSPENRFVESGEELPVSLCVNAAMDVELAWDLLTHLLRAAEILGVDAEKRTRWAKIRDQLPPLKVGSKGQLLEWGEELTEAEPGHRHFSHLLALYPGEQICPRRTPELAAAARRSLELRLAAGGGHTGWSRALTACLWARLGEGDKAFKHLSHLVCDFATASLLDLHPPRIFQIDGNLGGVAAVAEMLLGSYRGELHFLPALPQVWPDGRVVGLRARGGFRVDIEWRGRTFRQATIVPAVDGPCHIVDGDGLYEVRSADGSAVETRREGELLVFDARAAACYVCAPR